MRICIPTQDEKGMDALVFGHFGSAPYFTIVDTEKGTVDVIDNSNQHHEHGMCNPLGAVEGKRVDAVVTGGMGARAVQKLNEGGLKVYRAASGTVRVVADQLKAGMLEEITVINACGHHHGCH